MHVSMKTNAFKDFLYPPEGHADTASKSYNGFTGLFQAHLGDLLPHHRVVFFSKSVGRVCFQSILMSLFIELVVPRFFVGHVCLLKHYAQ